MNPINPIALVILSVSTATSATTLVSFTPNLPIPDDSSVGVADFQIVNSEIVNITAISVVLGVEGGFNGDYYVYLLHNGGFSVLLNRPGRTAVNEFGYADSGFNVQFTTTAPADVHLYRETANPAGAALTGTWQVDGRQTDPLFTQDTSPRTAMLESFVGEDPDGVWVIYIADRSSGGVGRLTNWSLNIEGTVPEPSNAILLLGTLMLRFRRRR